MKERNLPRTICVLLLAAVLLSLFMPLLSIKVQASTDYSTVLDDLTKAGNFKIENFPNLTLDYVKKVNEDTDKTNDQALLEVIQIGESGSGELYLYVYQPTDSESEMIATSVLLSTEFSPDGQNLNTDIYDLELVSSDSVFDKYVVKDFRVSEEPYRYYNIVTLYRGFNPDIDEVTPGGVIENFQLGIGVGQQWCAYYKNDSIVYEMNTFATVDVDIGYTGSVNFSQGIKLNNFYGKFESGDLWLALFNVEDYIVDKIFDAELRYKIRSMENTFGVGIDETTYGEWSDYIPLTLTSEDTATYGGDGLLAKEYTWNKIAKSSDFIAQLEEQNIVISDELREGLSKNAWVFAFLLTERQTYSYGYTQSSSSSDVSNVTVIRLHFMDINGDIYNLGVVSDQVNPDNTPDGYGNGIEVDSEWFDKMLVYLMIIVLLLIFIFLFPFVKGLFSLVWKAVSFLFEMLVSILAFPFRLLGFIFTGKWR